MGVDFRRVSKLKVNDFPIIFETVDTLTFWETLLKYCKLRRNRVISGAVDSSTVCGVSSSNKS